MCGCGSQPAAPPSQAASAATTRVDAATAGNVTGRVTYDGPALPNPSIKLDSDPACARQHPNGMALEAVLVNNGGLDNVFVYVKDGLSDYAFDTPTEPVRLDQKVPLHAARVRAARRSAAGDRERRSDAAHGARDGTGEPGVQPVAAAAGHLAHQDVHGAGGDGAPAQRPHLDGGLAGVVSHRIPRSARTAAGSS